MTIFFGITLIVGALVIIFWPLFKNSGHDELTEPTGDTTVSNLLFNRDKLFSTISELDSDYAIGNLSKQDYSELRQRYEERAISVIKDLDDLQATPGHDTELSADDEVEHQVKKIRRAKKWLTCTNCGTRLEPDDNFCPNCGSPSRLICPNCTARCRPADHFCAYCGTRLSQESVSSSL